MSVLRSGAALSVTVLMAFSTAGLAAANDCLVDKRRNGSADVQLVFENDSSAEISVSFDVDREKDDGSGPSKTVFTKSIESGTKAYTNRSVGGSASNDFIVTFSSNTGLFESENYKFSILNSRTSSNTRITFYKARTQPPQNNARVTCKRFYNQKTDGKSRWEIRYTIVDVL